MSNPIKSLLKKIYYSESFNRHAVKLYSIVRPPPYRLDNMEFKHDIWNGISCIHGVQGRQIGENNTFPPEYKENIKTDHNQCKFEGSRNGLLINMTALRHMMPVWDESLQITTLLRDDFITFRNIPGKKLNLRQGYAFSKIGAAFPAYLARRKHNPLQDGELPPLETSFFTLGVGVFMVVRAMMEKGDLGVFETEPMTAEQIYEAADSSGALVSGEGKGCAGSKKMILEYIDVAMNGTYEIDNLSDQAKSAFDSLGDMSKFYKYLYPSCRIELYVKLNQYICALSLFALNSDKDNLTEAEKIIVENSLDYFEQQFGRKVTDNAVMNNIVSIVIMLLEELDDSSITDELVKHDFIQTDPENVSGYKITEITSKQNAIDRIKVITELMHDKCKKDLSEMNLALDKPQAPSISLDEMYERACGPFITEFY